MIDYSYKSKIMNSSIYNDYVNIRRSYYADYIYQKNGVVVNSTIDIETAEKLACFYNIKRRSDFKECERIYNASCKRTHRLKKRITDMITNNDCIFVTLTFTNQVLSSTNYDTRRKYVARFLKQVANDYIANIDFGKKNGRVHYHGIVVSNLINPLLWQYGTCNVKKCSCSPNDIVRLSKYINKLTNHAIKDTTKRYALIYSRKK